MSKTADFIEDISTIIDPLLNELKLKFIKFIISSFCVSNYFWSSENYYWH